MLQGKRDKRVLLVSTANLIAGSGIGIAVNALPFKDSTALIGDGIDVAGRVALMNRALAIMRNLRVRNDKP